MIPRILVIEDDTALQEYLKMLLRENNFSPIIKSTGSEGLASIEKRTPEVVLLDLTLPDIKGETVCMEIRKNYPQLPVIILTAKDAVEDKIRGLKLGADDYVTKPFDGEELIARIKARLRPIEGEERLTVSDLTLDSRKVEVFRGTKKIMLSPQEFKLLKYLMQNKEIVLTRDNILNRLWLYSPNVESRVVDVYMGYLRKKIDAGFKKKLLLSVRGFGYTIKE